MLWNLDPRTGEMVGERVITEGRGTMVRDFTGLAFSDDKETIYCATTSGGEWGGLVGDNHGLPPPPDRHIHIHIPSHPTPHPTTRQTSHSST